MASFAYIDALKLKFKTAEKLGAVGVCDVCTVSSINAFICVIDCYLELLASLNAWPASEYLNAKQGIHDDSKSCERAEGAVRRGWGWVDRAGSIYARRGAHRE